MKTRHAKHWSEEEDKFLRENYGTMDTEKIARILKRPVKGVTGRAWNIHIRKLPLFMRRRHLMEKREVS